VAEGVAAVRATEISGAEDPDGDADTGEPDWLGAALETAGERDWLGASVRAWRGDHARALRTSGPSAASVDAYA
jgi:hypothetical protein